MMNINRTQLMFSSFTGDEWHLVVTLHLLSYHLYEAVVENNATLGIKYAVTGLSAHVLRMLSALLSCQ